MEFVPIWSFDNYVPAHIASGRLKEEGIETWLRDENTVTIDPILSNAIGGIKLMVPRTEARRAWEILKGLERQHKATTPCPKCGSINIELISTPRNASNWVFALFGFFFANYAMSADQVFHCFDCDHEYPFKNENELPGQINA
jgi:hypothetical protein